MKKAFSLLEIIVVVVIIAIVSTMAVNKLFFTLDESNHLQIKTQLHLIKNGIVQHKNKTILLGQENTLNVLDNAQNDVPEELLFGSVLNQPLISTNSIQKQKAKWIKYSSNSYGIYLHNSKQLLFEYNSENGSFECDYKLDICKEMYE